MVKHELFTQKWLNEEIVASPLYGTIEEVLVGSNERVKEWEPLFIIRNQYDILEQITVGISGILSELKVNRNDVVCPGEVMAKIKADEFI